MELVNQQAIAGRPRHGPRAPNAISRAQVDGRHLELWRLQRQAGNRATAALVARRSTSPSAGVVQRQSLDQLGLPPGVDPSPTTMALKGRDTRRVKVYRMAYIDPGTQMNEVDALVLAAKLNASVGTAIHGRAFTRPGQPFDDPQSASLDPFMLEISVLYNAGPDSDVLTVTYQHAAEFTGYVVMLTDSGNGGVQDATMYRDTRLLPTDRYSNRHDTEDRGNISQLLVGSASEKNYDAYTKIAGEAARWQCVARHAHYLNDDSRFFVRSRSSEGLVRYVTFNTLWLSWASDFGKAYDIPDDRVVEAIRGSGFGHGVREAHENDMTSRDYDLDKGRPHRP